MSTHRPTLPSETLVLLQGCFRRVMCRDLKTKCGPSVAQGFRRPEFQEHGWGSPGLSAANQEPPCPYFFPQLDNVQPKAMPNMVPKERKAHEEAWESQRMKTATVEQWVIATLNTLLLPHVVGLHRRVTDWTLSSSEDAPKAGCMEHVAWSARLIH